MAMLNGARLHISDDEPAEVHQARVVLDAATAPLVALLARKIAFSPMPTAALEPCREAVRLSFGEHFRHLTPREREWVSNYVMEQALASAREILSVHEAPPSEDTPSRAARGRGRGHSGLVRKGDRARQG